MQNWYQRMPRWRSVVLIVLGVFIGAMLITPSVAHVGGTVAHLWNQHIKPKGDNRYFKQARVLFAQVGADGTLLEDKSKGATGAAKISTGRYNVDFSRNLIECSFVATAHEREAGRETTAEYGFYENPDLGFDTIRVAINNSSGVAVDEPFSILALCTTG